MCPIRFVACVCECIDAETCAAMQGASARCVFEVRLLCACNCLCACPWWHCCVCLFVRLCYGMRRGVRSIPGLRRRHGDVISDARARCTRNDCTQSASALHHALVCVFLL